METSEASEKRELGLSVPPEPQIDKIHTHYLSFLVLKSRESLVGEG